LIKFVSTDWFEDTSKKFSDKTQIIFLGFQKLETSELVILLSDGEIQSISQSTFVSIVMHSGRPQTDNTERGGDILKSMFNSLKELSPVQTDYVSDKKPICFFYQLEQIKFVLVCKFEMEMQLPSSSNVPTS
jgi:hypothetical protein